MLVKPSLAYAYPLTVSLKRYLLLVRGIAGDARKNILNFGSLNALRVLNWRVVKSI